MLGLQTRLVDAAFAAGVPRVIASDYALDFTRTTPGRNRNLDLRRAFMARIDAAPIRATSILNGAFADLLAGQAPIVLPRTRRVLHWGSAEREGCSPLDNHRYPDVAFTPAQTILRSAYTRG
ncbi:MULTISPECIES: hypothetical protein [unclassified Sphingomonas]|uniref:hypothetical protein n=1 Tax=unclassified Sphingomonas TaxID=196159 RepID=UPI0012E17F64|nr:hypothetical protein [Sphingomonas sp. Leaf20]